jgi:hypothetical protein
MGLGSGKRLASYHPVMQSRPGSFYWSEDLDESLNYWFWLRRVEGLADELLMARVEGLLREAPFDRYREVEGERRRAEYLTFWTNWKRTQVERQIEQSRASTPAEQKAHYEAVAAVGLVTYQVQWVVAPFGERWLFPPDAAVLGVEGATASGCLAAVLDAAQALSRTA